MTRDKILILDFGGPHKQNIARVIRKLQRYSEVKPYDTDIEKIKKENYKGIIFSGGSYSYNPKINKEIFDLNIPILAIGFGAQLIAKIFGGAREEKKDGNIFQDINLDNVNGFLKDLPLDRIYKDSGAGRIKEAPESFEIIGKSKDQIIAIENADKKILGINFHPEEDEDGPGKDIIKKFLEEYCQAKANWKLEEFLKEEIAKIREEIGEKEVLVGLSGGVDSSVAATMVHKAVGDQLTCVFIDNGLLRKDEGDDVERIFRDGFNMNLIRVDARERFLSGLAGVSDPEEKRKIIGETFIRVFEDEAKKLENVRYLVQGTIYPDLIESGVGGEMVKSHHNVGGLPEDIDFDGIIEPLKELFKDEVREAGLLLDIPEDLVMRQPFPGPGLAVRCLGEVNEDKLSILREADAIFREEIAKAGLSRDINQYFAVLTDLRSVGVTDSKRTYDYTLALRAVTTVDFMTAQWSKIPLEILDICSERICREVPGINRVVYDITSKPPATIEWE